MALTTNLVSYYKFDENTGGSVGDSSGNGNTLTWEGTLGSQWTTGNINSGGNFDSTKNNDAATGALTNIPNNNAAQSMAAWINPTAVNVLQCVFVTQGGAQFQINISGKLEIGKWGGGTLVTGNISISAGVFTHIAWTFDGTTHRLYVNGRADLTSITAPNTGSPVGIIAGAFNSGGGNANFTGIIDELGFWSRALSSTEVTQLYNNGAGLQYPFFISPFPSHLRV